MHKKVLKTALVQVIFYAGLLLAWHITASLKIWPEYLFPSPAKVLQAIINGFSDRSFGIAILTSLRRIAFGFGVSILLGSCVGFLMARYRIVNDTLGRLVMAIQTMPSICWFPMSILWFGLSEAAILFIVIMGSVFSITISVYFGISNIPKIYLQTARNMGARRVAMLWWVFIPAAAPALLTGLRQGWSFAWRSLMAGELLFVSLGLGHLLMMGRELNDISQVFAVILMILGVSIAIDICVFGVLESSLKRRWGRG